MLQIVEILRLCFSLWVDLNKMQTFCHVFVAMYQICYLGQNKFAIEISLGMFFKLLEIF